MVSVQYMSDLHLERLKYDYTIVKSAPALILAGDIGRFCDYERYRDFLAKQCAQFEHVLLVAGNHEFYGSSREESLESAERLVNDVSMQGKLHFLNRGRFDLPDSTMTVLGCTLHSYIAPDYTKLTNDFEYTRGWRVKDHNAEHEMDLAWLKESLSNIDQSGCKREVIIATHYAPLFEGSCHPKNE